MITSVHLCSFTIHLHCMRSRKEGIDEGGIKFSIDVL